VVASPSILNFRLLWELQALQPTVVADYQFSTATWGLGFGLRQKLTNRTTFNLEWIPVLHRPAWYYYPRQDRTICYNSLSVGFDIETGGHVFQLHFSKSAGMTEPQFITQTTNQWQRNR
jgi:hypothetical protein